MLRAILLASALLVPTALAAWHAPGSQEPSTERDRADGRMFPEPDTLQGPERVYFNAYEAVVETSASPNSAALGTSILAPVVHHRAILGAWKDCNKDGYIGLAESAVLDYHAELLDLPNAHGVVPGTSVCPVTRAAPDQPLVHNDGTWVTEIVGIGMVDPCEFEDAAVRATCPGPSPAEPNVGAFARNERVLYSNDTYVWGDAGLPGEVPAGQCVLTPVPRGTTSSTGGALRWLDCQDGYLVAETVNATDEDGSLGLRFEDGREPQRSGSVLHQPLPVSAFGEASRPGLLQPESDAPAWTAWDCSDRVALRDPTAGPEGSGDLGEAAVQDPTPGARLSGNTFPMALTPFRFHDEDGDPSTGGWLRVRLEQDAGTYAYVPTPAPALHRADGSWVDAADAAVDGPRGDCDPRSPNHVARSAALVQVERGDDVVPAARKDQATLTFTFYDGHRGLHPSVDPTTGEGMPSDAGLILQRHGRGGDGPMWSALAPSTQDPQLVRRGDLEPSGATYVTYYARVGSDVVATYALLLPAPLPGTYGAENCGGARTGVEKGWVCDPALWWRDAGGADVRPRYALGQPIGRVPGDPYDLRDVDCYDGSLVPQEGVRAALGDACAL